MIGTFSLFLCSVASRHRHHRASSSSSLSSCCCIIIASSSLCVTSSLSLRRVAVRLRHCRCFAHVVIIVSWASRHITSHLVMSSSVAAVATAAVAAAAPAAIAVAVAVVVIIRSSHCCCVAWCRITLHHITARCVVEPSLSLHHRCCRRWVVTSSWSSRCHHIASHRVASSLSPSGRRIVESSSSWCHVTRRPCRRVVIIESSCVVAVAAIGHCRHCRVAVHRRCCCRIVGFASCPISLRRRHRASPPL